MTVRSAVLALRPRAVVLTAALALVVLAAGIGPGARRTPPARADTVPPAGVPATVSADALPTWQINGVVWSQVTVGNTVYATGSFTKARPPGVAAGSTQEVAAANVFAFDIRTGARVASFNHALDAQGMSLAASPDGTRVYLGGDFTRVDGQPRSHIAAFDTATNALVPTFTPAVNARVRAMAVTGSTVYVGGSFSSVAGQARKRLAAVTPAGALTSWKPTADDAAVLAMALAPDGSRVVVGGAFTTLNGTRAYGMGSLSTATGAQLPWAANTVVKDATPNGAITSLRADATQIYGSGYALGAGSSFEGSFAANPSTGAIAWLNDCHGDTYDVRPVGQVLYSVGHAHDCRWVSSFPETSPRSFHRTLASTTYPRGVNRGPDNYGWNYNGVPASRPLHWWPNLSIGSYTGQSQAAWSLSCNADYLVLGGEFLSVNGTKQQGLVRFARSGLAPNKRGIESPNLVVTASSPAAGTARLTWGAQWDMDNETLRYDVYRDGSATPVRTLSRASSFWVRPALTVDDVGVPRGTHTYQVVVRDPFGNLARSATVPVTVQ